MAWFATSPTIDPVRPAIAKLQRAGVDGGAAGIRLRLVKMVVPENTLTAPLRLICGACRVV
jgi:hypothetical protein